MEAELCDNKLIIPNQFSKQQYSKISRTKDKNNENKQQTQKITVIYKNISEIYSDDRNKQVSFYSQQERKDEIRKKNRPTRRRNLHQFTAIYIIYKTKQWFLLTFNI
ncbi:Hypothetical_protein [Hexamita inflata]|uniref:Hypothetical_protein n=1 Tax=Hexamita inflata TaxID=28002 RepID=A0AA86QNZ9_9EUKA|nr:Hypothetical protein HINF_LOCUS47862 [Hexamita inflata]